MSNNKEKKEYIVNKGEKPQAFADPEKTYSPVGELSRQEKTERRQRRSGTLLGTNEKKLDREEFRKAGFQRRWMNDKDGRLDSAYNNDYDFVLNSTGEKIKRRVGSKDNGDDLFAFLMEKPIDWYKDDQKAKLARDSRTQAINNKRAIANASKDVKIYRPDGDNAALRELED